MRKNVVIGLVLFVCTGCASHLQTFDSQDRLAKGIPVRTPALVEVERVTSYQLVTTESAMARYCTPDTAVTLEFLPIGEQYYLSIDPAALGKSEFSVEISDAGALKKVTLGSDPGTATAVEAATGLVSAVLPFAAVPKQQPPGEPFTVDFDSSAKELKEKHCAKTKAAVTSVKRKTID